jgi:hypothetical protein
MERGSANKTHDHMWSLFLDALSARGTLFDAPAIIEGL